MPIPTPPHQSPLQSRYAEKYSDDPRTDLLSLVDPSVRTILEVGCGSGATGEMIKRARPDVEYWGIDIEAEAVARARTRIDHALVADMDRVSLEDYDVRRSHFDLVICADVLEHLYDPWKTLAILRQYLRPDGAVLASIPNIQNIAVLDGLSRGFWSYANYGLLDATHIRFFTLTEIIRLFEGTGYRLEQCLSKCVPEMPQDGVWPRDLHFGSIVIPAVDQHRALQLHTFQYLVLARSTGAPALTVPT